MWTYCLLFENEKEKLPGLEKGKIFKLKKETINHKNNRDLLQMYINTLSNLSYVLSACSISFPSATRSTMEKKKNDTDG